MTDDANPFDAYADPPEALPGQELRPGPEPSLWQSFSNNFGGNFGGLTRGVQNLMAARTMNRADIAQPGDSPLLGKPSQGEVDAARHRFEEDQRAADSYASFHSDTVAGKAAGLLGGAAGALLAPENLITGGGLVAGGTMAGLRTVGVAGAAARVIGGAAEAGAVNAGIDAASQGLNIAAGTQQSYDPTQGVISFGAGAALGGGMHAIAEGIGAGRAHRDAIEAQGQPAPPVMAPDAQQGAITADTGATPVGGQPAPGLASSAGVPATPPAPVVMPDPEIAAARARVQQQTAAIDDTTLDKVAGAIALTDPRSAAADGSVQVPLSINEAATLKQAGINVDERGTMPASEAAGLVAERNRRDAEPAQAPQTPAQALAEQTPPSDREAAQGLPAVTPEAMAPSPTDLPTGPTPPPPDGATILGQGRLGPIVQGLKGRWADAVSWLSSARTGDVQGVLEHPGVPGPIDLAWGNDQHGFRHIMEKHPEVVADLPERLAAMQVESRSANRIILASPDNRAVVRLDYDGEAKTWLMTAYETGDRRVRGSTERPDASGVDTSSTPPANPNMGPNGGTVETHALRGDVVPGMQPHRVATADGKGVEVAPIVVEARDLTTSADAGYDPALQPRDRDRAASQAQIRDIAGNLDPERLGFSAEADRGAPIIGNDGAVESGNGRVMAVRQAYDQGGEAATRYRDWLAEQGVDVSRYDQPVLVRQRLTNMTPEDRRAFTVSANQAATLSMGASERAVADSHIITPERLDLLRNADDLGAASNAEFRRAFVGALPASERGAMTAADGSISAEGLTRIRNAVLASAYGDSPVLARITEATHDEAKSISNALTAAAPEWARLRADIAAGRVPTDFDLRADLLEAVQRTSDLRAKGVRLADHLAQMDAFDRMSSRVEQFMRIFADPTGRKAAGAQRITDALRFYAEEARKVSAERGLDLGLAPIHPDDIQERALAQAHAKATEATAAGERGPTLFERGGRGDGTGSGEGGGQARRSGVGEPGRGAAGASDAIRAGEEAGSRRGSGRGRSSRATAGRDAPNLDGLSDERAQPLRADQMAARTGLPPQGFDADSRFPNRRALAGEDSKPRVLPADATPEEVQAFRVNDAMRSIAARMDRKLEVDRRFNTKGSLGEYSPKQGVLRLRQEGDVEVFSHELGHAIDQRLLNGAETGVEFKALRSRFADELRLLDANTTDPAKQTVKEGVAEFLRSYLTNPAYARRRAPNFADAFDRLVDARDPELRGILNDTARLSQIDSGMAPIDVFRTMISSGGKPTGIAKFRAEARRLGALPTLSLWYDRAYASIVSPDHWAKRFQDQLREARFQKTGKPLPEFGWSDPYKMLRGLPGAKQAALDGIYYGVRGYGASFKDAVRSPAIYDALSEAFGGHVTLLADQDHPLVKAFSGYLIARRSRALYERFRNGEIRNPPVRASENEVHAGIADFEKAYPQFAGAAQKVFDFNSAMWTKKFESGLIDRKLYETIAGRNDDYVPFFRDMSDNQAGSGRGGSGGGAGQASSIVKRFGGSSRQIIDPIHSLVYDAVQTERVIALNDVFKAMHDLARSGGEFSGRFLEQVPNTELRAVSVDIAEGLRAAARRAGLEQADTETMIRHIESMVGDDLSATVFKATQTTAKGERIAFYWRDGQRVALKIGDDEISKAFFDTVSSMSTSHRDLLLAMFGKVNGLFSQLCVQAPQFAIKNLLMDNLSRIFIARNTGILGRTPGAGIGAGAYTMLFDREFSKAYAAFGGHRGGVVAAASRELSQARGLSAVTARPNSLAAVKAEVMHLMGHPKDLLVEAVKSPMHAFEKTVQFIEGSETLGRLGQARIVFNHLKKQGLSDEEAFHGALYEARDTLDYDRRGTGTAAAVKFFTFLNPAIQATERSARVLVGDPLRVAIEAYNRGGLANVDEAGKTALSDAVKNYGAIALGATAAMGYAAWNADDPVYQGASAYMRMKYFMFPLGRAEGEKQMVVTLPKPFDHAGGIMAAVEAAFYGMRRQDPQTWANVRAALLDGFLPRQVSSWQDFVAGNPHIKTAFEVMTGQKLGFAGDNPRPIVPEAMQKLPPELQYSGFTSYLAKKIGQQFEVSPLVVDHVISSEGGTFGKDLNYLMTGMLDDQPNVSAGDAMTRMFFGSLYREAHSGQARDDVMELMGRTSGQYTQAAQGYLGALKMGDREMADGYYRKANDTAKVMMTMEAMKARSGSDPGFTTTERQLHPLTRTAEIGSILSSITRELASSHVQVMDKSRKGYEAAQYIEVPGEVARSIANTVQAWGAEEARNGLAAVGEPGYGAFKQVDTGARLDAVIAASPEIGSEIEKRIQAAHILPMADVVKVWPEVQRRILQDRESAKVADLLPAGVPRSPPRSKKPRAAAAAAAAAFAPMAQPEAQPEPADAD